MTPPPRRLPLVERLRRLDPPIDDPEAAIRDFRVTVDGAVVTNPASLVRPDARVVVGRPRPPQGVRKLGHALDAFGVEVAGAIVVDLGACTGGFTVALLERGAARVYAVDVGFGQLLGRLQQDPRVVNLERTNVADVTPRLLDDGHPDLVVVDVTKLSLRTVAAQIAANDVPRSGTLLVGLVKPMFELGAGELPEGDALEASLRLAADGIQEAGWDVVATMRSEVVGHRGAIEFFVEARWP